MSDYYIISRQESIPSRQITNDNLREVSQELWDSTVYGETAVSLLEKGRHFTDASIWAVDEHLDPNTTQIPRSKQEMTDRVLDIWDHQHYPYEPQVVHNASDEHWPAFSYGEPGPVTRLRLADLSRHRGYDDHELHGTLGKTFDVLSVISGIKKASSVGAAHVETEFITASELRAHLRNNELPKYYRDEINSALLRAIVDAVYHVKPPEYGEVVFEGYLPNPGSGHRFDQVAVASLVAMAKKFPEDRPTAQVLRKFASS